MMSDHTLTTIASRIAAIQESYVRSQEKIKQLEHQLDRKEHDSALRVIDILDTIETVRPYLTEENARSTASVMMNKIEKKLNELLRYWQIEAIDLTSKRIEAGKVRVLEARKVNDSTQVNTIIDVCRKGYQRGQKIIRPADVITGIN